MTHISRATICGKIDRIQSEIESIETVFYASWRLYPVPPLENIEKLQSRIDTLTVQIINTNDAVANSPDASIFKCFGDVVAALGRKMERLADEVEEIRNGDPNYEGPGTAASEFARITKEFASMDETLGDISPLHRDEIRPILSRMWRKKSWCSIGLRVLATTISLPEHSTLFDRFNPTIIELFAKSRLVGRKMRSLAEENLLDDLDDEGGETLTDPHPSNDTMPSDEATPAQAIPDTSDLAGLRESILQATDEKQLSKTLLVYVDALESTSIFLAWERRDVSDDQDRVQKRSFAQFEEDFEAKDLKTHLKRYEARLVEREDALQTLRQEIEVRIGDAEKLDIGMKDVKLRLKKHGRRQRPSVRK